MRDHSPTEIWILDMSTHIAPHSRFDISEMTRLCRQITNHMHTQQFNQPIRNNIELVRREIPTLSEKPGRQINSHPPQPSTQIHRPTRPPGTIEPMIHLTPRNSHEQSDGAVGDREGGWLIEGHQTSDAR